MPETLWADQRTPALSIVKKGEVSRLPMGLFQVASQSSPGRHYMVSQREGAWACECDHFLAVGRQCIHIIATRLSLQVEPAPSVPAEAERVTYAQAWSAYNAAQSQEVRLFDALLADLVASLPAEDGPRKKGNQPLPMQEQVFCAVQKVYSQLSSRRAASLFDNAQERGQLDHAPHFNAPSKFLNRPEATPLLRALIRESAKPLAGLEMDFAIDSTGFTTTGFGAYFPEKHHVKRQHEWLKAHFCVGTKTHVVVDVAVTDGHGGDSPQFAPLVKATAEGFFVNEVSADKAYASKANHWVVASIGGQAIIPFKQGQNAPATGRVGSNKGAPPGAAKLWRKAYHYFQLNQEEFYARYHKRSNVESVNSAIKRKFGETLKSKNRVAQENELLCKVLAYNLTVLIHEMHESGIRAIFAAPQMGPKAA